LSILKDIKEDLTSLSKPAYAISAILLLLLPIVLEYYHKDFYVNMIFLSLMYGIAAMAWNLMMGYTGLFSLGHAVFFGVGAYTVMVLEVKYHITPWIGIPLAGASAAFLAVLISFPFLRLRTHWFTLGTIALGEVFKLGFAHWSYVGGAAGLQAPMVPPSQKLLYLQYKGAFVYVYLAIAVLAIELFVLKRIVNSKLGYYLVTIREDEIAAESLGINTFKYKTISMIISGLFTGLAGSLYAVRFEYVDPFAVFDLITISTFISVAGIIGGVYTFLGPLLGAFVLMPIEEYIRATVVSALPRVYGLDIAVLGVIILLISLFWPEGILGYIEKKRGK
jgi:branched-chain amino acid transport system permease protein